MRAGDVTWAVIEKPNHRSWDDMSCELCISDNSHSGQRFAQRAAASSFSVAEAASHVDSGCFSVGRTGSQ